MRTKIVVLILALALSSVPALAGSVFGGRRDGPGDKHRHRHERHRHERHRLVWVHPRSGGAPGEGPCGQRNGHPPRRHPPTQARWERGRGTWDRELLGHLVGGVTGGLLGSGIGAGTGRSAAIVGGTVLGVLIGGGVGRSMDEVDRLRLGQTLERTPTKDSVTWRNPDSETRYVVTPVATYQDRGGRYCREYRTRAVIGGRSEEVYGTACRQPDGSWELVR